ncbi:hypothetical protein PEC730217_15160 [Pectobacterium carotovorum subsp. carotovorum]|nr:Hypothetical protein SCC1_3730 [Pectobacterium versatile]GKW32736.1 hypothetical protein PEC730217_15160 [Pectobacterium carotovorum subsp. carotovorum]
MNSDVAQQPVAASTFAVMSQRRHEYKFIYKQCVVTNGVIKNKLSQIK